MAVALGAAAEACATTIAMDGNPANREGSQAVVATDDLCGLTHPTQPAEDILPAFATVDATNTYSGIDVTDVEGRPSPCDI